MYPYMYPTNQMAYGPYYYPMMYRGEEIQSNEEFDEEQENVELWEDARVEQGGAALQNGKGNASMFVPGTLMQQPQPGAMQPGMMMQPGTMQPGMMSQPGAMMPGMNALTEMLTQPGAMQQDTFALVLKQIQVEAPQILSALITLGMSIETLRQIVLRIMEAANKDQK